MSPDSARSEWIKSRNSLTKAVKTKLEIFSLAEFQLVLRCIGTVLSRQELLYDTP